MPLHLDERMSGTTMTLKIRRSCEEDGTRISLSGELRYAHLLELRAELEQIGEPVTLDLDEVDVIDIDGIRMLNACEAQGCEVLNCTPYIRKWMLQEMGSRGDDQ